MRRDFEAPDVEFTQRIDEVMRPAHFVPDSKPVDALLSEMQANRQHIEVVVDEYGGYGGPDHDRGHPRRGDRRRDHRRVRRGGGRGRGAPVGHHRVSSRYPIDDLDELFGFDVERRTSTASAA